MRRCSDWSSESDDPLSDDTLLLAPVPGEGEGGEDGWEVDDWSVSCLVPVMQGDGKLTLLGPMAE